MIYENNYYYAGTDAILYKVELDKIGFYVDESSPYRTKTDRNITEVGVHIIEQTTGGLNESCSILAAPDNLPTISGTHTKTINNCMCDIISGGGTYPSNRVLPIRVVFKNLTPGATYNIHSYYIEDGNTTRFNSCTVTTMAHQDITYQCTEVVKEQSSIPDAQKDALKVNLDKACEIFNSMTSFTRANSQFDSVGSKTGGSFTATISTTAEGQGESSMKFRPGSTLSVCVHEMAHNLMFPTFGIDKSKVIKFMEFATHAENATWAWLGEHNYPVISSAEYNEVMNYFVAAACYVCRDAGGVI